jgi:hypothetical protein
VFVFFLCLLLLTIRAGWFARKLQFWGVSWAVEPLVLLFFLRGMLGFLVVVVGFVEVGWLCD